MGTLFFLFDSLYVSILKCFHTNSFAKTELFISLYTGFIAQIKKKKIVGAVKVDLRSTTMCYQMSVELIPHATLFMYF